MAFYQGNLKPVSFKQASKILDYYSVAIGYDSYMYDAHRSRRNYDYNKTVCLNNRKSNISIMPRQQDYGFGLSSHSETVSYWFEFVNIDPFAVDSTSQASHTNDFLDKRYIKFENGYYEIVYEYGDLEDEGFTMELNEYNGPLFETFEKAVEAFLWLLKSERSHPYRGSIKYGVGSYLLLKNEQSISWNTKGFCYIRDIVTPTTDSYMIKELSVIINHEIIKEKFRNELTQEGTIFVDAADLNWEFIEEKMFDIKKLDLRKGLKNSLN